MTHEMRLAPSCARPSEELAEICEQLGAVEPVPLFHPSPVAVHTVTQSFGVASVDLARLGVALGSGVILAAQGHVARADRVSELSR